MNVTYTNGSPRDALVALLEAEFPDWRVVPAERATDVPDRPMLVVKQRSLTDLPQAPIAQLTIGFYVTIVAHQTDPTLAEPALDANVLAVWGLLKVTKGYQPKTATKVAFDQQHLAYDIETDVNVGITKETP